MEVPHDKCPNNDEGSHIPITDEIGEVAYCLCGKVFDEENLSRMEERYFGPHDKLPDRRHHSPLTPDRQSNTVISKSANDAKGMEIPKDVREKFRKLQKWETMSKYSDGKKKEPQSCNSAYAEILEQDVRKHKFFYRRGHFSDL